MKEDLPPTNFMSMESGLEEPPPSLQPRLHGHKWSYRLQHIVAPALPTPRSNNVLESGGVGPLMVQ